MNALEREARNQQESIHVRYDTLRKQAMEFSEETKEQIHRSFASAYDAAAIDTYAAGRRIAEEFKRRNAEVNKRHVTQTTALSVAYGRSRATLDLAQRRAVRAVMDRLDRLQTRLGMAEARETAEADRRTAVIATDTSETMREAPSVIPENEDSKGPYHAEVKTSALNISLLPTDVRKNYENAQKILALNKNTEDSLSGAAEILRDQAQAYVKQIEAIYGGGRTKTTQMFVSLYGDRTRFAQSNTSGYRTYEAYVDAVVTPNLAKLYRSGSVTADDAAWLATFYNIHPQTGDKSLDAVISNIKATTVEPSVVQAWSSSNYDIAKQLEEYSQEERWGHPDTALLKAIRAQQQASYNIQQYIHANRARFGEQYDTANAEYDRYIKFLDEAEKYVAGRNDVYSSYTDRASYEHAVFVNDIENMTAKEVKAYHSKRQKEADKKIPLLEEELKEINGRKTYRSIVDRVGDYASDADKKRAEEINRELEALKSNIAYVDDTGKNITYEDLIDSKEWDDYVKKQVEWLSTFEDWEKATTYETTNPNNVGYTPAPELGSDEWRVDWTYETIHKPDDGEQVAMTDKLATYMTEDEKKLYSYYLKSRDGQDELDARARAAEFYKALKPYLELRQNKALIQNFADFTEKEPFWGWVLARGANIFSAPEYLFDTVRSVFTGKADENLAARVASTIDGVNMKNTDWKIGDWDAFDFLYSTGSSFTDSALQMPLAAVNPWLASAAMGMQAAAHAQNEALDRGMDDGQVIATSLFAGVAEMLCERVPIGKLISIKNAGISGGKELAKSIASQIVTEVPQEFLTEVANIIYDISCNGDFSQYETDVRMYRQQGMSEEEARSKAAGNLGVRIVEATASGLLMGLPFGADASFSSWRQSKALGQTVSDVDFLVEVAKQLDGTRAQKLALEVEAGNLKDAKIGALLLETNAELAKIGEEGTNAIYEKAMANLETQIAEDADSFTDEDLADFAEATGIDATLDEMRAAEAMNAEDAAAADASPIPSYTPPKSATEVKSYSNEQTDKLSRKLSRNVYFYDGANQRGVEGGFYDRKTNSIYINKNAPQNRMSYATVLAHEYVHSLEIASEDYKALRDATFSSNVYARYLKSAGTEGRMSLTHDQHVQQIIKRYGFHGVDAVTRAEQEILANVLSETFLRNEKSLVELAGQDRNLFMKLWAWVRRMIVRLGKSEETLKLEALFRKVAKASTEAHNAKADEQIDASSETQKHPTEDGEVQLSLDGNSAQKNKRVAPKRKNVYNAFWTEVLSWANRASTKNGDGLVIADTRKGAGRNKFCLFKADGEGGYVQIAYGTYERVREEYERAYEETIDEIYVCVEEYGIDKGRDIWNLHPDDIGRYAFGDYDTLEGLEFQRFPSGDAEYLHASDRGDAVKLSLPDQTESQYLGKMLADASITKATKAQIYADSPLYDVLHGTDRFAAAHEILRDRDQLVDVVKRVSKGKAATEAHNAKVDAQIDATADADGEVQRSQSDGGYDGRSIDMYDQRSYINFGWVVVNNVLTPTEYKSFNKQFAEATMNGYKYPKNQDGEYMIVVGDIYSFVDEQGRPTRMQHANKIVFVSGTMQSPIISKVVEVNYDLADDVSYYVEGVKDGEKDGFDFIAFAQILDGETILRVYENRDFSSYTGSWRSPENGRSMQSGYENRGGEHQRGRSGSESERGAGIKLSLPDQTESQYLGKMLADASIAKATKAQIYADSPLYDVLHDTDRFAAAREILRDRNQLVDVIKRVSKGEAATEAHNAKADAQIDTASEMQKHPTEDGEVQYAFGVTQEDINEYVDNAYIKNNDEDYKKYAKTSERLIADVSEEIDVSEYAHALRDNDIRHIWNSHGEQTNEKYPVTKSDIKIVPYIISNYDKVYVVKRNDGRIGLVYVKVFSEGLVYYLEQVTDKYGNENLLVNKQMIKTGHGDIPDIKGLQTAITKKQSKIEFLDDLSKVPKVYVQNVYQSYSKDSIPDPSRKSNSPSSEDSAAGDSVQHSLPNQPPIDPALFKREAGLEATAKVLDAAGKALRRDALEHELLLKEAPLTRLYTCPDHRDRSRYVPDIAERYAAALSQTVIFYRGYSSAGAETGFAYRGRFFVNTNAPRTHNALGVVLGLDYVRNCRSQTVPFYELCKMVLASEGCLRRLQEAGITQEQCLQRAVHQLRHIGKSASEQAAIEELVTQILCEELLQSETRLAAFAAENREVFAELWSHVRRRLVRIGTTPNSIKLALMFLNAKHSAESTARETDAEVKYSPGDKKDSVASIDNYNQRTYTNFGWAVVNDVLSPTEYTSFNQQLGEAVHQGTWYPKTPDGEYMFWVNDRGQRSNKVVFASGSPSNPIISKVVEVDRNVTDDISYYVTEVIEYAGTDFDFIRFAEDVAGKTIFKTHEIENLPSYTEMRRAQQKSRSVQDRREDRGREQHRGRGGAPRGRHADITYSVPDQDEPRTAIQTDTVSTNAKSQGTAGMAAMIGGDELPLHEEPILLRVIDATNPKAVIRELRNFEKRANAVEKGLYRAENFAIIESMSRYINSSDQLFDNISKVQPVDGYEDVFIHGDKNGFVIKDKDGHEIEYYSPREFAEILKKDPNYHGGPIRLFACESAAGGALSAQMLANQLNVEILAPSDVIWIDSQGEIIIGSLMDAKCGVSTGEWVVVRPMADD